MPKIKIYCAHKMTGRYKDELRLEAEYTKRYLENHGFEVLDPILDENLPMVHEIFDGDPTMLESHWRRDKAMLKEADVMLDYMACNQSDGVAKELGYMRFCLWKPVVRVFPKLGKCISRIEDDVIAESMEEAVSAIKTRFGTYELLRQWRDEMWHRCYFKWLEEQIKMNDRYSITRTVSNATVHLEVI